MLSRAARWWGASSRGMVPRSMAVSTRAFRMESFRSFDRQSLAYGSFGRGKALLCFNGLACDADSWRYVVNYFSRRFRVVVFDYRGHGNSPRPDRQDNITMDTNARDGLALLRRLRIKKAVLVGHSMGGQVALEFVHRFPEQVRALVLVLCAYRTPLSTLEAGKALAVPFLKLCRDEPDVVRRMLEATAPGPIGFLVGRAIGMYNPFYCRPEDWRHYLEHYASFDHETYGRMALSLQEHDATDYLSEIQVPTLIIGGERDTISPPRIAEEMRQKIPDSELFMLRHGSHIGHLEHAELVNLRIEKFLKERVD